MSADARQDSQKCTGLSATGTPSLSFVATQDIDEQAALLSGWNQTYNQISSGAFDGRLIDVDLGSMRLFREVTSSALQQSGALPPDLVAVGVPMSLSGPATFCGCACDGQQLHVFSGNDQFEFFSPSGLDIVGFVIRKSELFGGVDAGFGDITDRQLAAPHLKAIEPDCANSLRQVFTDVCQVVAQDAGHAARSSVYSAMLDDVRASICAAIVSNADDASCRDVGLSPARRVTIVRNVHELVIASPECYQNVENLCGTLGISRRTLQHAFHETLGIKPSGYLRAVRLNGARRAIKQEASVTEAATEWGFWHFGRFAQDYRMMFGELPSETARVVRRV